ncbi:P-loop containing nucleoside triphosphate hydrolase [Pseudocohnilembus persalinus]|uniref:p-loop containing nucleoside triphosphate hydrolase n=1 Tax=Pseudocohnilembus persalinus TaxID=266149 RepID=A0A0V0QV68_PSEPJ|nr:P-loop containing nucleoside triphosphate hydrolase [Pseudocohnilembus persalinus]|eukprot:KRX05930.1 P-loop containing nucleoside triphosphate hydrolase [Pseudocohnilembus persalinus]
MIENKLVQKNSVEHKKLEKYKQFLDSQNQFDDLNCSVQAILNESLDQSLNSTLCSQLQNFCYLSWDCQNEEQNQQKEGNMEEKEEKKEEEKKIDENREIKTNGKKNKEKDVQKKKEQTLKCPIKGCNTQYQRPNCIFNHFNKSHQKDSIMKYLKDLESQDYLMMIDFKIKYNRQANMNVNGLNNQNNKGEKNIKNQINFQNDLGQSLDQSLNSTTASINFADIQQSNESTAQYPFPYTSNQVNQHEVNDQTYSDLVDDIWQPSQQEIYNSIQQKNKKQNYESNYKEVQQLIENKGKQERQILNRIEMSSQSEFNARIQSNLFYNKSYLFLIIHLLFYIIESECYQKEYVKPQSINTVQQIQQKQQHQQEEEQKRQVENNYNQKTNINYQNNKENNNKSLNTQLTLDQLKQVQNELGISDYPDSQVLKGLQFDADVFNMFLRIDYNIDQCFINPSKNFNGQLHSFQKHALNFLLYRENYFKNKKQFIKIQNIFENEILPGSQDYQDSQGGILADTMGLGKTIMFISLILTNDNYNKNNKCGNLLICPLTIIEQWGQQLEKFSNNKLKIGIYRGPDRNQMNFKQYDVIMATQQTVYSEYNKNKDKDNIFAENWHRIILDEGHYIRNDTTSTAKSIFTINADNKWIVSGTPIQNSLRDCYSYFKLINHKELSDLKVFEEHFGSAKQKVYTKSQYKVLQNYLIPIMLSRSKQSKDYKGELILKLPAKNMITHNLEMNQYEREIYDYFFSDELPALAKVICLRQICDHYTQIKNEYLDGDQFIKDKIRDFKFKKIVPVKFEKTLQICKGAIQKQEKVVIFVQFLDFVFDLVEYLKQQLKSVKKINDIQFLNGTIQNIDERQEIIDNFQYRDEFPILVVSLKAGGVGLNLNSGNHVIVYDPWYNPAIVDQAICRTHRLGQEKDVQVHSLIYNCTVEQRIEQIKQNKESMINQLFQYYSFTQFKHKFNEDKDFQNLKPPQINIQDQKNEESPFKLKKKTNQKQKSYTNQDGIFKRSLKFAFKFLLAGGIFYGGYIFYQNFKAQLKIQEQIQAVKSELEEAKKAPQQDKNKIMYLFETLSSMYIQNEEFKYAIEILEEAIQFSQNKHSQFFALLGQAKVGLNGEKQDEEELLQIVQKTLELDPKNIQAYYGLSKYYRFFKDTSKLESITNKMLQISSTSPEAYRNLAVIQMYHQNYQQALKLVDLAFCLNPTQQDNYILKSLIFNEIQQQAQQALKKIKIKMNDNELKRIHSDIDLKGALSVLEIGKLDVASYLVDQAIEKDHTNMEAYFLKAQILFNSGQFDEAIEQLEEAIQTGIEDSKVKYFMAKIYKGMGQTEKGNQCIEEAIQKENQFQQLLQADKKKGLQVYFDKYNGEIIQ